MKTYEKIYQILLDETGGISGEALATQLDLSRTSIWKAIKTLERKGLTIASSRHEGYRLVDGDLYLPSQLSEELGLPIYYKEDSSSTQLDAKIGMEEDHASPALYLAPSQLAAKGRYGRPFYAGKRGGIYMSLRLSPHVPFSEFKPYTVLVAAAIVKTIQEKTGSPVQIKWVNDIYLNSKKIAGVLTEAISSIEAHTVTDVIIGVGINFHLDRFPEELKDKAGNLFDGAPSLSRQELVTAIWKTFFQTSEAELMQVYKDNSLVLGKEVSFVRQDRTYTGIAKKITDTGHLVVELQDGSTKVLFSGEISLSSW